MKYCYIFLVMCAFPIKIYAQISGKVIHRLLVSRDVSGIVKDSTDQAVPGAVILLESIKDTLKTSTNPDGIFVFKDVKEANFLITIKSIGFKPSTRKYLNNEETAHVVLEPVLLKDNVNNLKEVEINGAKSIIYKTDTVEYRASDYKVRTNATVDELLKKMEGIEVGANGSLKYQGQQISKAKLNGKDYAGGNVSQAITNLPAEIVNRIQIVNDYGEQASRTGIKDGAATPILNITTKADKSVGNILRLTAIEGSRERYDERVFSQHLNANKQIVLLGNITTALNGVPEQSAGQTSSRISESGGKTTSGGPSFSYRDQLSKQLQINTSYVYNFNNVDLVRNTSGQLLSSLGSTSFKRDNTGANKSKWHKALIEFEFTPDSSNFLRVVPSLSYSTIANINNDNYTQQGFQNQYSTGTSINKNSSPTFETALFYQHVFRKYPGKNISAELNLSYNDQRFDAEQNTHIQYRDSMQRTVKDSIVHRMINNNGNEKNYVFGLTYTEPLSKTSRINFSTKINYKGYSNHLLTNNIDSNGFKTIINSLSNNYKYSFTKYRLAVDYTYNKSTISATVGVAAIPTQIRSSTINKVSDANHANLFVIPVFRIQYQLSTSQQLALNYYGNPIEPRFIQIQPIPDFSDPQNPVYGNPDLKFAFAHSAELSYNNYIANSKMNISATINTDFYQDLVAVNTIQVYQTETNSFLNEIHFVNLSGAKSIAGRYNVSKQLDNRKYNLSLNGFISYHYDVGMSNNVLNHLTTWRYNERFGPRLNPNSSIEINPFVSYDIIKTTNSLSSSNSAASNSDIRTLALNVEGKFFLLKNRSLTIEYNISKNYITGIASNITKNPFVANFYTEINMFSKKNGILRLSVFDLFDQNNFINREVTANGYTDIRSSLLSRYVSISFILNLQKWSGTPERNGKSLKRRGDGSFIY